jgi:hypothetical protein
MNLVTELHAVCAALVRAQIRHAICGGVAVTIHGAICKRALRRSRGPAPRRAARPMRPRESPPAALKTCRVEMVCPWGVETLIWC